MTSWSRVRPHVAAWDLRKTYDAAWQKFQPNIANMIIEPIDIAEYTSQFDLVISTIPAWSICMKPKEHRFDSIPILVHKGLNSIEIGVASHSDNWVIYNGKSEHIWYRASSIFGYKSVEARSHPRMMNEARWESGFKVVGNNCDCHPNIVRAGRMGLWTGGVLTHHAFETTTEAISEQFGVLSPSSLS